MRFATSWLRWGLSRDAALLVAGQGVRAAGYGFTAVVLGALLAARGYSAVRAAVVLTALIAGAALGSLLVGAVADTPSGRTAAAAVTNAARYTVRPLGPLVAGAVQQLALGVPLLLAGVVKGGYDLAMWRWARRFELPGSDKATGPNPSIAAAEPVGAIGEPS